MEIQAHLVMLKIRSRKKGPALLNLQVERQRVILLQSQIRAAGTG
jgi:hypothetical protein